MQQLSSVKREKGSLVAPVPRFPANHVIFDKISNLILEPSFSKHWFEFAEQAINAIYDAGEKPDFLCGKILKRFSSRLFQSSDSEPMVVHSEPKDENEELAAPIPDNMESSLKRCKTAELSKFCFLVGHVAMKQIVHLEAIESEWKRRKHLGMINEHLMLETKSKTPKKAADDLDQVTGTAEDEFTEKILEIRERSLLYGEKSLLGQYGPLLTFICTNNRSFNVNFVLLILGWLAPEYGCDCTLQVYVR